MSMRYFCLGARKAMFRERKREKCGQRRGRGLRAINKREIRGGGAEATDRTRNRKKSKRHNKTTGRRKKK